MVSVLTEMGVPEGQIVERQNGTGNALKMILDEVKKFSFSGFVKVALIDKVNRSEGMILFEDGDPIVAAYIFRRSGGKKERLYKGGKAAEFIWQDSVCQDAIITLHAKIQTREIASIFQGGEVNRVELLPPPWIPNPVRPIDVEMLKGVDENVAKRIVKWSESGYDVQSLLVLYDNNPKKAAKALSCFEGNIEKIEEMKEALQFLKTNGYERESESLLRKMSDPERVSDIQAELEALRNKVEMSDSAVMAEKQIQDDMERKKLDERVDGVYDLILQYHKMSSQGIPKRTKCPNCGGPLDSSGNCPGCIGAGEKAAYGRALNPRLTFESFVTGPNNSFAEAAARAAAMTPGKAYNPLFIYSRSGLGKTHLLQAIGNYARERSPRLRVIYSSTDAIEEELIVSLASKRLEEFRTTYRDADLLIIDDLQFLAGKEQIQEEIFHIFNDLMDKNKQIVMACDRLPKEIPSVGDRLATRFESGLIADIQPPDLQTRLAILESRAKEDKLSVPKDVLGFVAEVCKDNVRQLEGGLNRVVAFSSLMRSDITIKLAKEILTREAKEARSAKVKVEVQDGQSYLVEEEKPEVSHRIFASKLKEGYKGLAITRGHPRVLREKLVNMEAVVFWLTDHESKTERTVLPSLERIMLIIEEFSQPDKKSIVLLDDIQYLISNTTFEGIVRFIRNVVDEVSERPAIFLVSVNQESLKTQERSILEREMEVIRHRE
ncbi:MAG: DnaA/Hda family protein [Methanomassiliicoccales archaeon]|jgi:chromosomal replication initiator protein DnaA